MGKEQRDALRFSAGVDGILNRKGSTEKEGKSPQSDELLALAARLATIEVDGMELLRADLRRQLMMRLSRKSESSRRRRHIPRLLPEMPRVAFAAVAGLLLVLALGFTPAGRSVVRAVEQFVSEIRWPNTEVRQATPSDLPPDSEEARARFERELAAGRAWEFSFEESNFGGCCADGVRNEVVPLSQAIAEAGHELQLPSFLPDGYVLDEIRLLDLPPYLVFVTYVGPDGPLGLYQNTVGVIATEHPAPNTVSVDARASAVITDGVIEEVTVGEVTAAFVDGSTLVWEEDSRSYQLIGPGLDLDTLSQIAESLEPVQ